LDPRTAYRTVVVLRCRVNPTASWKRQATVTSPDERGSGACTSLSETFLLSSQLQAAMALRQTEHVMVFSGVTSPTPRHVNMLYFGRVVGPWRPRSLSGKEVSLIRPIFGATTRGRCIFPVLWSYELKQHLSSLRSLSQSFWCANDCRSVALTTHCLRLPSGGCHRLVSVVRHALVVVSQKFASSSCFRAAPAHDVITFVVFGNTAIS